MQLNWTLKIECDHQYIQVERDPELVFPNDEISQIIRKVSELWDLLPEDLDEVCTWDDKSITMTFEVLDNIQSFMYWFTMNVVPKTLTLTRIKDWND